MRRSAPRRLPITEPPRREAPRTVDLAVRYVPTWALLVLPCLAVVGVVDWFVAVLGCARLVTVVCSVVSLGGSAMILGWLLGMAVNERNRK